MIYAVDFDGTLYTGATPFPKVDPQYLNMELLTYLEELQKREPHSRFILWTCREGREVTVALEAIAKRSTIRWDAVNDNVPEIKIQYQDSRKIIADVYIDDRAIQPSDFLKR